jgi:beta-glucosidase
LLQDWFSARWSGILKVPFNGPCRIGLEGNDGYRLYIDDSLMIDNWKKVSFGMQWVDLDLQNNRSYTLKVEYYETSGNGKLRLVWDAGVADSSQTKMQEALALAKRTDAVLVVCGIEEGEFRDRARLELPGGQGQMIRELADAGKPLIVVLTGGSAVDVSSWEKDADAIVEAWYSGDEGGTALARLLFGEIDPSGRLPFSWPMEVGQLPLVYDHQPTGRGDDYVDLSGMPRYPFGYGLSYTRFEYSDLQLSTTSIKAADTLFVNIRIKNTGDREGAEIVQLYVHDEIASVVRPVKELKAFQRVELKPGEQRSVKFALPPSAFSFYGSDHKEVIEPGDIKIMIGASSADIRLRGSVTIK